MYDKAEKRSVHADKRHKIFEHKSAVGVDRTAALEDGEVSLHKNKSGKKSRGSSGSDSDSSSSSSDDLSSSSLDDSSSARVTTRMTSFSTFNLFRYVSIGTAGNNINGGTNVFRG